MGRRTEKRITIRFDATLIERLTLLKPWIHSYLASMDLVFEGASIPNDSDVIRLAVEDFARRLEVLRTAAVGQPPPRPSPPPLTLFPEPAPPPKKGRHVPHGKMPWPADFVLTEERREYARFHLGCTDQEATDLWTHFEAHHTAAGSLFKSWSQAWITWVIKEKQYRGRLARLSPGYRQTATSLEERIAKARAKFPHG